jgi:hypothetical protein
MERLDRELSGAQHKGAGFFESSGLNSANAEALHKLLLDGWASSKDVCQRGLHEFAVHQPCKKFAN